MENILDLSQKVTLKVKVRDAEYMVNVPDLSQVMEYQKRVSKVKGEDGGHIKAMIDFADELGFPKSEGEHLQFPQFEKLMKSLLELSEKK